MTPLGNSISIKVETVREKKGIYIPETIPIKGSKFGTIVIGNEEYPEGSRVLFMDTGTLDDEKACELMGGEIKIVNTNKVILW